MTIAFMKDENGMVTTRHFMPLDPEYGLGDRDEAESQGWIFIDSLPEPEDNGKTALLYYRGGNFEYEYRDMEPVPGNEVVQLRKELVEANVKVDKLTAADLDNKEMIATLYELTLMRGMN